MRLHHILESKSYKQVMIALREQMPMIIGKLAIDQLVAQADLAINQIASNIKNRAQYRNQLAANDPVYKFILDAMPN